MNYKDLNLKTDKSTSLIKIGDKEVNVLKYLPIEDKIDLIQITLQKSLENDIYNEMKIDMFFNLYIIYMYTDLTFTAEDREDEFKLYDELESNNVINEVIGAMDDIEYDRLMECLKTMRNEHTFYNRSAASLIRAFIQDMPKNAAAAAEIVDHFDKEKYQNVIDFAKSANGNRPIN